MSASNQDAPDDLVLALIASGLESGSEHPPAEQLLAYAEGQLSDEANERILNHLSSCSECALTVADLATFPDIEADGENLRSAAQEAEDWTAVVERTSSAARRRAESTSTLAASPTSGDVGRLSGWLVAALLAMTLLGLSIGGLLRQQEHGQQATVNIHFQELSPVGTHTRRSGDYTRVTVPPEMTSYLLFLPVASLKPFDFYELIVLDASGEQRLRSRELKRTAEGGFTVQWPRSALPEGRYRIEVLGLEGSTRDPLATFQIQLEVP